MTASPQGSPMVRSGCNVAPVFIHNTFYSAESRTGSTSCLNLAVMFDSCHCTGLCAHNHHFHRIRWPTRDIYCECAWTPPEAYMLRDMTWPFVVTLHNAVCNPSLREMLIERVESWSTAGKELDALEGRPCLMPLDDPLF
jgi:hypothetical protein